MRLYFYLLSIPKQRHSRNLTTGVLDLKNTHFVMLLLKHFILLFQNVCVVKLSSTFRTCRLYLEETQPRHKEKTTQSEINMFSCIFI